MKFMTNKSAYLDNICGNTELLIVIQTWVSAYKFCHFKITCLLKGISFSYVPITKDTGNFFSSLKRDSSVVIKM